MSVNNLSAYYCACYRNSWSSLAGLFTLGRPAAAASPLSSSTSSTIMQRMRQAIPPVSWAGQSAEARERQPVRREVGRRQRISYPDNLTSKSTPSFTDYSLRC